MYNKLRTIENVNGSMLAKINRILANNVMQTLIKLKTLMLPLSKITISCEFKTNMTKGTEHKHTFKEI